jgi:ankyrin repeat protein
VRCLLELGACPSEALFCASAGPNAAALQLLLQHGGNARQRASHWTPLLSAVRCGSEAAVRALLG